MSEKRNIYDKHAALPQEVSRRMLARLQFIKINPKRILDVGAATGFASRLLEQQFPKAKIISLDHNLAMLQQARHQTKRWFSHQTFICADTYKIPLQKHSIDFIFANMLLPWCEDLTAVLQEWQRVLRPEGLVMFSTCGPQTLPELQACSGLVFNFPNILEVGSATASAFHDPVLDSENFTLSYKNVSQLLRELRVLGAPPLITSRAEIKHTIRNYINFRDANKRIPATVEVIYGHAWARDMSNKHTQIGEVEIPLAQLKQSLPK